MEVCEVVPVAAVVPVFLIGTHGATEGPLLILLLYATLTRGKCASFPLMITV